MIINKHIDSQKNIKGIFDTYFKALVVFGASYLDDTDEAEDLVQATLLELWKSELIFPNENALKSYLYKTVKNKCFNLLKHHKVKDRYAKEKENAEENYFEINENIVEHESARLLHLGIQKLHPRKKEIIELSLKGLSNDVIAERLDIKIQTVKNLKSDAYKSLKSFIKKTEE